MDGNYSLLYEDAVVKIVSCPICKTSFGIVNNVSVRKAHRCLKSCVDMKVGSLPKYAKFKDADPDSPVIFRLVKTRWDGVSELRYYVDNGCWDVDFEIIKGKLISKHEYDHLNNRELIPSDYQEYLSKVGTYAVKEGSAKTASDSEDVSWANSDIPS